MNEWLVQTCQVSFDEKKQERIRMLYADETAARRRGLMRGIFL
jgi:hypothetical protein